LRERGFGVKSMHGPSQGANPNRLPARSIFLVGSEVACFPQRMVVVFF
jgi:hypothetical protein